jgi:DNA repair protein RadC
MKYLSIKQWAVDDRPREKLLNHGARIMSEAELIGILLGSGTRELSAIELARNVLLKGDNNLLELGKLSVNELTEIRGIGEAKAVTLIAALELGRRRGNVLPSEKPKVTSSKQAFDIFQSLFYDLHHEEFWVAFLNRSNLLIERNQISQGGLSGTVTDIRILMRKALELRASNVIICHNHPSGNIVPSQQDRKITQKINNAASLFDIKLLDHLIIGNTSKYFSFADEGIL